MNKNSKRINYDSINSTLRKNLLSGSALLLTTGMAIGIIAPISAFAEDAAVDAADAGTVVVTGTRAPSEKQDQPIVVDSIKFDDLETIAGDGYIATQLVQLPGVSAVEDADAPRYITIRGISSSLNVTTFDGITLATVGNSGSGDRRVNLQLLPSELSEQTDIYKTFTAEQDGGAIGGIIDLNSRNAFRYTKKLYKNFDAYGIYSTYAGLGQLSSGGDTRKHWGGGIKGTIAGTFWNDQFGFVLSGRHEERTRNSTKQWTEGIYFYDEEGNRLSNSQDEKWNGLPTSYSYNTADYPNILTSEGGSLKLQWRSKDDTMHASIIGYGYDRSEDSTMNKHDFYIKQSADIIDQTDTTGTQLINSFYIKWRHDDWSRSAKGAIGNFDWEKGRSKFKLAAGHSEEEYSNYEIYIGARAYPKNYYASYEWDNPSDSLPQITSVTSTETTQDTSIYKTYKADYTWEKAIEKLDEIRGDYSFNTGSSDRGLGVAAGFSIRDMTISKDETLISYKTGGSAASYLYNNGIVQAGTIVSFPWIDYSKFESLVLPTLSVDTSDQEYNNAISDYSYDENIYAAYLSLHYQTDKWNFIIGERYDKADYTAHTPQDDDGVLLSEWAEYNGNYDNFLPSFNATYKANRNTNIRFSYSKTLGRPTPANIAQAQKTSCSEDEDGDTCSITKGNPDLRPRRSENFDIYFEHFMPKSRGVIAAGFFAKNISDDIFTLTVPTVIDDVTYKIKQPMNADESTLSGFEFQYKNSTKNFFGRKLTYGLNLTYMDGETNFTSDSGTRKISHLLEQPKYIASANVSYYFPSIGGGITLNTSYRSKYYTSFAANPDDDDGRDELQTVNLSFWYKIFKNATLKYEFTNIFDQQPKFLTGSGLQYRSEIDEYGRGFYLHLIIK